MTQPPTSDNASQKPDRQENRLSDGGINAPQEQPIFPERLPKSLMEWLARINQRYLALEQESTHDTS